MALFHTSLTQGIHFWYYFPYLRSRSFIKVKVNVHLNIKLSKFAYFPDKYNGSKRVTLQLYLVFFLIVKNTNSIIITI